MSATAVNNATRLMLPEMQRAETALRSAAAAAGIVYTVADFGGLRTQADTTRILEYRANDYAKYVAAQKKAGAVVVPVERWRPIAAFGNSYHNFGAAIDLRITQRPDGWSYDRALRRLGDLAPAAGLRWGGTFKRVDSPHFELAIPLSEARRLWLARHPAPGVRAAVDVAGRANPAVLLWVLVAGVLLSVLMRNR